MSVAFLKEESAEAASETILPDRPISPHLNLVTEAGRAALDAQLSLAREALEQANLIDDVNERRRQSAVPMRDIRYLVERIRTAQVVENTVSPDKVAFGCTVAFSRDGGPTQAYRIVGEDEADPKAGTISYVSPLAKALTGKEVGDIFDFGSQEIEILTIGYSAARQT